MQSHDNPRPGMRGSALVLVEDQRSALAAVLVLQEMGFSVDIASQPEGALSWVQHARYEWIVCSGGGEHSRSADFAQRLRFAAPQARILLVDGPVDLLESLAVEVLRPPVDVNMLMDRFAERAA
jgi:DNA-binding response OmpR family regulator